MSLSSHTTSPTGAQLRWLHRPDSARAAVLVLHGGQAHGTTATSWRQPSVLRARLFGSALARRARREGVSVAFLRYAVRGWNGGAPVADGRWALEQVRGLHPDRPLGLLGYSMGGRVALRLCGEPQLRSLVTAAAWVEAPDLQHVAPADGLEALLLHGSQDRVTSPRGSSLAAEHLRSRGARVELRTDLDDTHALLRQARTWHTLAAEHLMGSLARV